MEWKNKYEKINSCLSNNDKPVIGIIGNYADNACLLNSPYYQSVLNAGGIPFIIPPMRMNETERVDALRKFLEPLDGIIFSGGGDVNPLLIGEEPIVGLGGVNPERDEEELLLVRMAADRQIPILGICRGIQMITAALGGELYQDIYSQKKDCELLKHSQSMARDVASHSVEIMSGSILAKIYGSERIYVNSFHHQAVKTAAPGMRVSARSADGIIEAVESCEEKSIIGVQWHPECMYEEIHRKLMGRDVFDWMIDEAKSFRKAKQLHRSILSLDSHCDTPTFFHLSRTTELGLPIGQIDFIKRDEEKQVDLQKMIDGQLDATIMVAYLQQQERDDVSLRQATDRANRIIDHVEEMVKQVNEASIGKEILRIARTPDELYECKHEGQRAIMLGIENGYAIGRDLRNVEKFRERGIVYMTLCHNGDNDLCDAAVKSNNEHGGVSQYGAEVIREMNRVGMMVDLSHGGEKSFFDAIEISSKPIVCSHSSSRALCNHPRNLTDEQLRALARIGGVAQVTIYSGFLRTDEQVALDGRKASIFDVIEHLNHMVDVMGVEHVGLGTDFDGGGGVPGCMNAGELINFTRQLLRRRYSDKDIQLIWGDNFLRVMREVQKGC